MDGTYDGYRTRSATLSESIARYPYPLFEVLSPAWRGALFAGSALVMTLSSVLLKAVYEQVNGKYLTEPGRSTSRPGSLKH